MTALWVGDWKLAKFQVAAGAKGLGRLLMTCADCLKREVRFTGVMWLHALQGVNEEPEATHAQLAGLRHEAALDATAWPKGVTH